MHHTLKIHPIPFQQQEQGEKPFEIRLDDRNFQKGDTVTFKEWDPCTLDYTGWESPERVIMLVYKHDDLPDAIQPGWCVFSHRQVDTGK